MGRLASTNYEVEMSIFLTQDDIAELTGRKKKSCQIDQLRNMGVAFRVNASGRPVVTIAAVEGGKIEKFDIEWKPAVLGK